MDCLNVQVCCGWPWNPWGKHVRKSSGTRRLRDAPRPPQCSSSGIHEYPTNQLQFHAFPLPNKLATPGRHKIVRYQARGPYSTYRHHPSTPRHPDFCKDKGESCHGLHCLYRVPIDLIAAGTQNQSVRDRTRLLSIHYDYPGLGRMTTPCCGCDYNCTLSMEFPLLV
jgi:hypothetical protein